MSKPTPNPTRLSGWPETEDTLGVARMFRNARQLPDEELPTLRWRLRTSQRLRAMRPRLVLRVALVVGIAFCTGGVVGAVVWPFWGTRHSAVVSPEPVAAPTSERKKQRASLAAPVAPAPVAPAADEAGSGPNEPKLVPAPARHRAAVPVALVHEPVPPPATPDVAPETAPPATVPSPIAVEQALLGDAMKRLRDGRDARRALALLAEHAERFPTGALTAEATMLRIEALLDLGRRDEALAILDRAPLASLPNRDQQLVARGELRAAKGRWREAKQDFDGVLREHERLAAGQKARDLRERALWGRAAARSRLGDQEGARADLALYLHHFPEGRFAGAAASLVKGAP